ncbi:MAG: hypothetical protein JST48_10965 [Bacteroidetes bacterium]|nr:hypothetical protein [Bacteroidota bacterium]
MALYLTSNGTAPRLSGSAFWDIDLSKLDFERYSDFTITRVFERGTAQDIHEILDYYGKPRATDTLKRAASLSPRAIALGRKILGISPDQLACSKYTPRAMSYSMY